MKEYFKNLYSMRLEKNLKQIDNFLESAKPPTLNQEEMGTDAQAAGGNREQCTAQRLEANGQREAAGQACFRLRPF